MKRFGIMILALFILAFYGCGAASVEAIAESSEIQAATQVETQTLSSSGSNLEIYFFSAGKADAILLTTENSTVLIDAGEKGFGKEILAHLEEQGISYIDYMIITHFDQDHVGGAAKVINNISVGTVLQSNCPKDSEEYEKYCNALLSASIEPITVEETMTFELDGVTYVVDPPRKDDYVEDDSNNSSLIVSVYNGENSFLFAGDAQTERLEEFLDSNSETYDFLKVPHHGGDDELMDDLITEISPSYAVITSSDEELEADSTTSYLAEANVETYLTRKGAIVLDSDGTNISISYAA